MLADELGLDPGPQLQALHQQILTADPRLAPPAPGPAPPGSPSSVGQVPAQGRRQLTGSRTLAAKPSPPIESRLVRTGHDYQPAQASHSSHESVVPRQLPAGTRHFAGRTAELADLDALLRETAEANATSVVVITGAGGIGKTALALHWAHHVASHYPDGQLHVNLRGYDPSGAAVSASDGVRLLLDSLGVRREQIPAAHEARAGLYRSVVAGRRMLVLLDNARDAEQVRPLLPGSAGCLVLVTSRSALSGLVATEGAHPVPLGLLADEEAAALLAARLGANRTSADRSALQLLVRLCGGLPLALAITAARAAAQPALPLFALAEELTDEQHRLDALDTGDQMTSLRAAFSWSCRQLTGWRHGCSGYWPPIRGRTSRPPRPRAWLACRPRTPAAHWANWSRPAC